jgi:putative membrane protein
MSTESESGPGRFDVTPTAESHFSWLRTRMSVERTLMSWVRTSIALIGFGFTIYQVLRSLSADAKIPPSPSPRYLGLALIGTGIIGLVIGLIEYHSTVRYLWTKEFKSISGIGPSPGRTPLVAVVYLLILIGIWAFGAVYLRAR